MKRFIARYWFLILLAFGATFLVLSKRFFQTHPLPVVVSLNPFSGELTSLPPRVEIGFKSLVGFSQTDFSLVAQPDLNLKLGKKENLLFFELPENITSGEKYLFELRYQNQPLYSWSYSLTVIPTIILKKAVSGRGDPVAVERIQEEINQEYPLIKYLPQETEDYYLNYDGPLVLGIRVKKGSKEEVLEQVKNWLKEMGADPDSHQLIWFE